MNGYIPGVFGLLNGIISWRMIGFGSRIEFITCGSFEYHGGFWSVAVAGGRIASSWRTFCLSLGSVLVFDRVFGDMKVERLRWFALFLEVYCRLVLGAMTLSWVLVLLILLRIGMHHTRKFQFEWLYDAMTCLSDVLLWVAVCSIALRFGLFRSKASLHYVMMWVSSNQSSIKC